MPDLSPFLYIRSAIACLRAALFQNDKKPKTTRTRAHPASRAVRAMTSVCVRDVLFYLYFTYYLLKEKFTYLYIFFIFYFMGFFNIASVPSSPLSMKGSITVSQWHAKLWCRVHSWPLSNMFLCVCLLRTIDDSHPKARHRLNFVFQPHYHVKISVI